MLGVIPCRNVLLAISWLWEGSPTSSPANPGTRCGTGHSGTPAELSPAGTETQNEFPAPLGPGSAGIQLSLWHLTPLQ